MTELRTRGNDRADATARPWVVRFPNGAAEILSSSGGERSSHEHALSDGQLAGLIGSLRQVSGVQVHVDGDDLWLRGEELDDRMELTLRSLPDAARYLVTTDGELTAWGETVPRAWLPEGIWQPLAEWLTVKLPTAAFAARVEQRVPLRLVRSEALSEANVLRTTWTIWRDYAISAPQFRLNQWSFAVSDRDEVLIRGLPLPPLPGRRLVEHADVAIPAGFGPDPPIDPESIRLVLRLKPGEIAVFREDGELELIPESAFVRATRSAVRLTDDASANQVEPH